MGRPLRAAAGGVLYHVLNRANGRLPLFEKAGDYEAFERVLGEAHERLAMRTLAYCVMPNHWRMILWPRQDRRPVAISGVGDPHAHATLACAPAIRGGGASVPRPLQVVPGAEG